MKCSKCEEEGKTPKEIRSTGCSTRTLMAVYGYYDDDENWHVHDWNTCVTEYTCSRNHTFVHEGDNLCPAAGCGWKR